MNKTIASVISLCAVVGVIIFLVAEQAMAQITFSVHLTDANGVGEPIGNVRLTNSDYGLLVTPELAGLPPGAHGFHIHSNPACGPADKEGNPVPGLAAGGHFDPREGGFHGGPYVNGHLGDLPLLYVDADGSASTPVLAPRLRLSDVLGRSLMIHSSGDNYSDDPAPLGGGGARLACGVLRLS